MAYKVYKSLVFLLEHLFRTSLFKKEAVTFCASLKKYILQFHFGKRDILKNQLSDGVLIICVVLLLVFPVCQLKKTFTEYQYKHSLELQASLKRKDLEAFNFLIDSGISRLKVGNIDEALSEFKLAYAIYPENPKVLSLIEEIQSKCYISDVKSH